MLENIKTPKAGKVEWIGLRPKRRAALLEVEKVEVSIEEGLIGDRHQSKKTKRQVTLIQKEHLDFVATLLGKVTISPQLTRRNIVVSGINLIALKNKQFQLGDVILEATGACHPCSRMEENLGDGGYHAMRGHGGITAKVIKAGTIQLGDEVKWLET